MVCEAFGGGVFTYVSQLCNDMVDDFDVYLAFSLRPQTSENYKDFLNGVGRLAFNGKKSTVIYTSHGYAHIFMGLGIKSRMYKFMEQILGKRNCRTLTCCKSEDGFLWIRDGELRQTRFAAPNTEIMGWKLRYEFLAMAKGADAFMLCSLGEAITMSLIEKEAVAA